MKAKITYGLAGLIVTGMAYGSATELMQGYRNAGGGPFSAAEGRAAWVQEHRPFSGEDTRSCASCHGTDLTLPGRHVKTRKPIEPMALSVNPRRLSDPEKVEKLLKELAEAAKKQNELIVKDELDEIYSRNGADMLNAGTGADTTTYFVSLPSNRLELWASLTARESARAYPQAALEELWQEVMLYQFHDVLPGSSIKRVYDECLARYAGMLKQTQTLTDDALQYLQHRAIRCEIAPTAETAEAYNRSTQRKAALVHVTC